MDFNVHLILMEEGGWGVTPFDKEANVCSYRLGEFISKRLFNAISRELSFTNTTPLPYFVKFWQIFQMEKAWNDHIISIFLASR